MRNQKTYQNPFWFNPQMYYMYPNPFWYNSQLCSMYMNYYMDSPNTYKLDTSEVETNIKDYRIEPFIVDIDDATKANKTFRTVLWTGENLQLTLMSIGVGDDIGLEVHENGDQFIRIEDGKGIIRMGDSQDNLDFQQRIYEDDAIMIPSGKWHNIINIGDEPLKLYAIYAPPEHPSNTVHETKDDAKENNRYYKY